MPAGGSDTNDTQAFCILDFHILDVGVGCLGAAKGGSA